MANAKGHFNTTGSLSKDSDQLRLLQTILIRGSDSGSGTVLFAGGNGDTITGGAHGGDYIVATTGNETLTGGNVIGTNYFFLGSGHDEVTLSAGSIVNTGSGSANIMNSGFASVFGGAGGANTYGATAGTMDVYGYRGGVDHVSSSVASASSAAGALALHLPDGATIILHGTTGV